MCCPSGKLLDAWGGATLGNHVAAQPPRGRACVGPGWVCVVGFVVRRRLRGQDARLAWRIPSTDWPRLVTSVPRETDCLGPSLVFAPCPPERGHS